MTKFLFIWKRGGRNTLRFKNELAANKFARDNFNIIEYWTTFKRRRKR